MRPDTKEEVARYVIGLNAQRYRVTAIRLEADGSKRAFVLGPKAGFENNELQLPARMAELAGLSARGENIYFTPISVNTHHLLVDDLNEANFERFINDGFRPAVVLESSPGNFQAILNVLKTGSLHDRAVGNRLIRLLNEKYGDPNLSGAVHPHRAPGFANKKPKHRRQDGSFPIVRLIYSDSVFCERAFNDSKEIEDGYCHPAACQKVVIASVDSEPPLELSEGVAAAFRAHRGDAIRRIGGRLVGLDLSRLDGMIAIRMRVTGHSQGAVVAAILHCAPQFRSAEIAESRNWRDYAIRTANYAFGPAGDEHFARLSKYKTQWKLLELRQKL